MEYRVVVGEKEYIVEAENPAELKEKIREIIVREALARAKVFIVTGEGEVEAPPEEFERLVEELKPREIRVVKADYAG